MANSIMVTNYALLIEQNIATIVKGLAAVSASDETTILLFLNQLDVYLYIENNGLILNNKEEL